MARKNKHKASLVQPFPSRPPYIATKEGKTVTPKRTIQKPDRTLTLKRIEAGLE